MMSFISIHIGEYGPKVEVVGQAHGPVTFERNIHGELMPPPILYHEKATYHSTKEFWKDNDKIYLIAHKLQMYAIELVEAED